MTGSRIVTAEYMLTDPDGGLVAVVQTGRDSAEADRAGEWMRTVMAAFHAPYGLYVTPHAIDVYAAGQGEVERNDGGTLLGPLMNELDVDADTVRRSTWTGLVEHFLLDLTGRFDEVDGVAPPARPRFAVIRNAVRWGDVERDVDCHLPSVAA